MRRRDSRTSRFSRLSSTGELVPAKAGILRPPSRVRLPLPARYSMLSDTGGAFGIPLPAYPSKLVLSEGGTPPLVRVLPPLFSLTPRTAKRSAVLRFLRTEVLRLRGLIGDARAWSAVLTAAARRDRGRDAAGASRAIPRKRKTVVVAGAGLGPASGAYGTPRKTFPDPPAPVRNFFPQAEKAYHGLPKMGIFQKWTGETLASQK